MRLSLLVLLVFLLPAPARALAPPEPPETAQKPAAPSILGVRLATRLGIDVTGAVGLQPPPASALGAVSGWLMWQPARAAAPQAAATTETTAAADSRFTFGLGLRLTHLRTADRDVFAGRAAAKGQGLQVEEPRLTALNAALQLRLRLLGHPDRHPLTAGFNIDLAGVSFGPARATQVLLPGGLAGPAFSTRPVRANVLLGNTNDRGTLNSELYLAYTVAPRLSVRAGWAHVASGYAYGGNRYQRFTNLAVLGLSLGLGSSGRAY